MSDDLDPTLANVPMLSVDQLREAEDGMYRILPTNTLHFWTWHPEHDRLFPLHVLKQGHMVHWLDHPYYGFMAELTLTELTVAPRYFVKIEATEDDQVSEVS
jgi:hypothetical protein